MARPNRVPLWQITASFVEDEESVAAAPVVEQRKDGTFHIRGVARHRTPASILANSAYHLSLPTRSDPLGSLGMRVEDEVRRVEIALCDDFNTVYYMRHAWIGADVISNGDYQIVCGMADFMALDELGAPRDECTTLLYRDPAGEHWNRLQG